jgi:hypothetical protein
MIPPYIDKNYYFPNKYISTVLQELQPVFTGFSQKTSIFSARCGKITVKKRGEPVWNATISRRTTRRIIRRTISSRRTTARTSSKEINPMESDPTGVAFCCVCFTKKQSAPIERQIQVCYIEIKLKHLLLI